MADSYVLLEGNDHVSLPLIDAIVLARDCGEYLWSARLGTGILGRIDCPSGRKGPAGRNEVVLALGDSGLSQLVEFGFIPCPTCEPEGDEGFWETIMLTVKEKYGLHDLDSFLDRAILPFDARRIDWETLVPITGSLPGRLYVPPNLHDENLLDISQRFTGLGVDLPEIGWYDVSSPEQFTEYSLPTHSASISCFVKRNS